MLTIPQIVADKTPPVDVVEYIMRHLLAQKVRAYEHGSCMYRNAKGLTCAVGCLIPAEVDPGRWNALAFHTAAEKLFPESLDGLYAPLPEGQNYMVYLDIMQKVHDGLPHVMEFNKQYLTKSIDELLEDSASEASMRLVFDAALARL